MSPGADCSRILLQAPWRLPKPQTKLRDQEKGHPRNRPLRALRICFGIASGHFKACNATENDRFGSWAPYLVLRDLVRAHRARDSNDFGSGAPYLRTGKIFFSL